ncbi:MAG: hypothetical protein U0528_12405 [Anaerolineae bacterium]
MSIAKRQRGGKRSNPLRSFIAITIFILFVSVTGYALAASEHADNPFDQIAYLSNWINDGEQLQLGMPQGSAGTPPRAFKVVGSVGAADTQLAQADESDTDIETDYDDGAVENTTSADTTTTFTGFRADGGDDAQPLAWDQIGDVLYDWWFICAVTAGFIVVQSVYKFSSKQLKNRLSAAAATK